MAWIITKDLINDDKRRKGCKSIDFKNQKECTERFKMLDDDGEVYYEGLATPDAVFAPLYDLGMPDAGCTEIQYYKNGKWETL